MPANMQVVEARSASRKVWVIYEVRRVLAAARDPCSWPPRKGRGAENTVWAHGCRHPPRGCFSFGHPLWKVGGCGMSLRVWGKRSGVLRTREGEGAAPSWGADPQGAGRVGTGARGPSSQPGLTASWLLAFAHSLSLSLSCLICNMGTEFLLCLHHTWA